MYEVNWNFQKGEVSEKIPFVREVSIFSGTTQSMDNITAKMLRDETTTNKTVSFNCC